MIQISFRSIQTNLAILASVSLLEVSLVAAEAGSINAIDDKPIISARANARGGALSTSADLFDSFYYNPAGLSGNTYFGESSKEPFVKQVLLPRFSVLANTNAIALKSEFESNGATNSSEKGSTLLKTHDGAHQYARLSLSPVVLFLGNLGVAPIIDQQISAIPSDSEESDVTFHFRSFNGAMLGSSLKDSRGIVSLGVSTLVGTIEDTEGTAPYRDMVDAEQRSKIFAASKKSYTANQLNAGLMIKPPKKWNPTFALVGRNIANSKNQSTDGGEPLVVREDLTAGVSVAPKIGKIGQWQLALEGSNLTDRHVESNAKVKLGSEITFGEDRDSRALAALKTGYNANGVSYGAHINLGLIGAEVSSHNENVSSSSSNKIFERHTTFILYIDAASF